MADQLLLSLYGMIDLQMYYFDGVRLKGIGVHLSRNIRRRFPPSSFSFFNKFPDTARSILSPSSADFFFPSCSCYNTSYLDDPFYLMPGSTCQ